MFVVMGLRFNESLLDLLDNLVKANARRGEATKLNSILHQSRV